MRPILAVPAIFALAAAHCIAAPVLNGDGECWMYLPARGSGPLPDGTPVVPQFVRAEGNCDLSWVGTGDASASYEHSYNISGNVFEFSGGVSSWAAWNTYFMEDPLEPGNMLSLPSESYARANMFADIPLRTSGPPRSGIITGHIEVSAYRNFNGQGAASVSIAGLSIACSPDYFIAPPYPCRINGQEVLSLPAVFTIPVILGRELAFDAGAETFGYSNADFNEGSGWGSGYISLSASFFESDGVTPVDVAIVPEPSCWLLCLSAIVIWSHRALTGPRAITEPPPSRNATR